MRHAGTCERTRAHGPDLYVNTRSRNALARPHAQISIYSINEVTVFTLPVCQNKVTRFLHMPVLGCDIYSRIQCTVQFVVVGDTG